MSLQDSLNFIQSGVSQYNNPRNSLAHQEILRLSRSGITDIRVRILPPKNPQDKFFQPFRQFYGSIEKRGYGFTLAPTNDPKDPLYKALQDWRANGQYPNKYNNGYSNRYYVNVAKVIAHDGRMTTEADENGLPDVYVMELNKTVMSDLVAKLEDQYSNPNVRFAKEMAEKGHPIPEEDSGWSFISAAFAYPIHITMMKSTPIKYVVDIDKDQLLYPLRKGWDTKLEDLSTLTVPSYQQNLQRVEDFIANANALLSKSTPVAPPVSNVSVGDKFGNKYGDGLPNPNDQTVEQVSKDTIPPAQSEPSVESKQAPGSSSQDSSNPMDGDDILGDLPDDLFNDLGE